MWKLLSDRGQQVWHYIAGEKKQQLPEYNPDVNPVSEQKRSRKESVCVNK
jgi:hypothetical protein